MSIGLELQNLAYLEGIHFHFSSKFVAIILNFNLLWKGLLVVYQLISKIAVKLAQKEALSTCCGRVILRPAYML